MSHIYRADLDETPQKRLPKKKNTMLTDGMRRNEVRTKIARLQCDKTLSTGLSTFEEGINLIYIGGPIRAGGSFVSF